MIKFPANFMWGAATSAPQSEGYALSYGKSASTWDQWYQMAPEKFKKDQGQIRRVILTAYIRKMLRI